MQPGSSQYKALMDTVKVEPAKVSLDLLNVKNNKYLTLELSGLEGNMARLRIDEKEPVKARYEPPIGDVLTQEPKLARWADTYQEFTS